MSKGKHSKPSLYRRLCGVWTANKLLSRKWWLIVGTVSVAIVADIIGRALDSATLEYLGIVVPAYLLVQGALDWRSGRKQEVQQTTRDRGEDI